MTIGATSVWRVRTGGNNLNGGGYDAAISGAATDYSQQDTAQWTSSSVTSSGTTCTDNTSAGTLTSAMVGNAVQLSGAIYFVTSVPTANTFVVDRAPAVTAVAAKLGGGWADPFANLTTAIVQPGNTVWIRGSGSQYPTSDDYARGVGIITMVNGSFAVGNIRLRGENGRPRISSSSVLYQSCSLNTFQDIYFKATGIGSGLAATGMINTNSGTVGSTCSFVNVMFDQGGFDLTMLSASATMLWCEVTSTVTPGSAGTQYAVFVVQEACSIYASNIHDTVGLGVRALGRLGTWIKGNIFSNCRGTALTMPESVTTDTGGSTVTNNTFDANQGDAIQIQGVTVLQQTTILNNIFTNHVTAGTYGINANFGTLAANDRIKGYQNYNNYFGNTNDVHNVSKGANDLALDPQYQAQATEGYNIGTNLKAKGFPQAAYVNSSSGMTATQAYIDVGAVQRKEGTAYALAAAQGSYSLTGKAAALSAGHNLAAAMGSYSLTGKTVAFKVARTLAAARGTYSLTGNAATLAYTPHGGGTAYALPAAAGAYSFTGRAAALTSARHLSLAMGSYSLTGNDALLTSGAPVAYALAAAMGSYVFTGRPATVAYQNNPRPAPVTATDIVNQAIQLIGGDQPLVTGVAPFFDSSASGKSAALLYWPAVQTVSRMFGFDFDRTTITLVPTGNTPPPPWTVEYFYPPMGIEIRQVMPVTPPDLNDPLPNDWSVANNTVAQVPTKVVQTNFSPAQAVYTNQPPEDLWDALFREAVVRLLASEFAMSIAGKPDLSQMLFEQFNEFLKAAISRQD
ncbi:MAG TPA: right-handed parallel beta-helix repeat-containing protein [Aliidongia sp.]|uniref:right-handed parallel beta-helix repeat-containing protein n=1 Tax=Aliidongia sp. TaxID=1914230 RepID=UPI002DDD2773|nr:right-handed parallel beta-helix repeat-containing protein [Aliidongia sp.]HEV2674172.1 right-handed parallel beta-helix repeat-containing protein [Aliidongia sp.]